MEPEIRQKLFNYFYEQHEIMLMEDDYMLIESGVQPLRRTDINKKGIYANNIVSIEQKLIKIEDVKSLMFWTARMAKGLLDSGKSEQDITDEIIKKYNSLVKAANG